MEIRKRRRREVRKEGVLWLELGVLASSWGGVVGGGGGSAGVRNRHPAYCCV